MFHFGVHGTRYHLKCLLLGQINTVFSIHMVGEQRTTWPSSLNYSEISLKVLNCHIFQQSKISILMLNPVNSTTHRVIPTKERPEQQRDILYVWPLPSPSDLVRFGMAICLATEGMGVGKLLVQVH